MWPSKRAGREESLRRASFRRPGDFGTAQAFGEPPASREPGERTAELGPSPSLASAEVQRQRPRAATRALPGAWPRTTNGRPVLRDDFLLVGSFASLFLWLERWSTRRRSCSSWRTSSGSIRRRATCGRDLSASSLKLHALHVTILKFYLALSTVGYEAVPFGSFLFLEGAFLSGSVLCGSRFLAFLVFRLRGSQLSTPP